MVKWLHFKPTANQLGYTLVEIFVTLAIASIVTVITVPTLTRVISAPPESDQLEQLRRALIEARNRTLIADVCATATIDTNKVTTVVYRQCNSAPPSNPIATKTVTFANLILEPFDVGKTIQFNPGGALENRKPATMKITTKTLRAYEIRILPAIGSIRMVERRY